MITKLLYFDLYGKKLPKNFKIKNFKAKNTSSSGGSGSGGSGSAKGGNGSDSKIAASTSLTRLLCWVIIVSFFKLFRSLNYKNIRILN